MASDFDASIQQALIQQIDSVLPQTQCGLCNYAGCRPYAEAIVLAHETINRCPPGGVNTLMNLAALTAQDPSPFMADVQQKAKPPLRAVIREAECIGCTKCIQACPVDAILGAAKQMHTVIGDECTGCELCISPCPVDCIDMVPRAAPTNSEQIQRANTARKRYQFRQQRLASSSHKKATNKTDLLMSRKAEIQAAIVRAKAKKATASKTIVAT